MIVTQAMSRSFPSFWCTLIAMCAAACAPVGPSDPSSGGVADDRFDRPNDDEPNDDDGPNDDGPNGVLLPDDLHDSVEAIRAAHELPALATLMWKGGAVVAEGAAGVRSVDALDAVTTNDAWHLGSCTKAMTATLAAMLVDDGVLHWSSTVDESFADAALDPGFAGVTLEDLVGNRGGVPEDMTDAQYEALWDLASSPAAHRARFAREVLAESPGGPRGTFAYSNSGFMIAGAMMERATGSSWEELMVARLFEPLGMTSCGFGAPGTEGAVDAPFGHYVDVDGVTTVPVPPGPYSDNPPAMGPAGTVHCALADWARFIQLHIDGARGVDTALVSPEAFTHLHTPGDGDYALGWDVTARDWGGSLLTHSGSNTLFMVTVWVAPEHDAAMFAATNRGDDDAYYALDEAFIPLVETYFAD